MSSSESNSLRQALAQSAPTGPHPDADLLTAFAEGALLDRERETMLGHLATCPACREALRLSVESVAAMEADMVPALAAASQPAFILARAAAPPAPTSTRPAPRTSRIWLPWATAAACVAIACSFVFVHIKNTHDAATATRQSHQNAVATGQTLAKTVPPPTLASSQSPSAAPALEENHLYKKALTGSPSQSVTVPARPAMTSNADSAMQSRQSLSPAQGQTKVSVESQSLSSPQVALSVPPAQQQALNQLVTAPTAKTSPTNQTITVNAEHAQKSPAPAASASTFSRSFNHAAMASSLSTARPHWRINSDDHLELAFNNGPWQPAHLSDPTLMHVVSVFGGEVWVGGEDTRLYRSADNGDTWQPVPLPDKNGSIHTITHIRFAGPRDITVEAADGTTWTTTDDGATWN